MTKAGKMFSGIHDWACNQLHTSITTVTTERKFRDAGQGSEIWSTQPDIRKPTLRPEEFDP